MTGRNLKILSNPLLTPSRDRPRLAAVSWPYAGRGHARYIHVHYAIIIIGRCEGCTGLQHTGQGPLGGVNLSFASTSECANGPLGAGITSTGGAYLTSRVSRCVKKKKCYCLINFEFDGPL